MFYLGDPRRKLGDPKRIDGALRDSYVNSQSFEELANDLDGLGSQKGVE